MQRMLCDIRMTASQIQRNDVPVVNTTWTETTLNNLEAGAPALDQIRHRHPHVVVVNLHMTLWRLIVAKNLHWSHNLDAGRVGGDEDDGLLSVLVAIVRVGLAHDDVKLASWVAGAADPP